MLEYRIWFTKLGFCCGFIGILLRNTNIGIVKLSNTKLVNCCDFIGILYRNTNIGIVAHNLPNWVFVVILLVSDMEVPTLV